MLAEGADVATEPFLAASDCRDQEPGESESNIRLRSLHAAEHHRVSDKVRSAFDSSKITV